MGALNGFLLGGYIGGVTTVDAPSGLPLGRGLYH